MPRYFLRFSYIGTRYRGIQKQIINGTTDFTTIQGFIEAALNKLQPASPARLATSSRTDAGVHAFSNTGHVDLVHPTPGCIFLPQTITKVVNHEMFTTDQDIRLLQSRLVPDYFRSTTCARQRTYVYRLAVHTGDDYVKLDKSLMAYLPAVEHYRCHVIRSPFDLSLVDSAAAVMVGVHDFTNFAGTLAHLKENPEFIRSVDQVEVQLSRGFMDPCLSPLYDHLTFYDVVIRARAFLNQQIRRMVAALIAVGKGFIKLSDITKMLEDPDDHRVRDRLMPAPPWGLYLQNVEYEEADFRLPDRYLDKFNLDKGVQYEVINS